MRNSTLKIFFYFILTFYSFSAFAIFGFKSFKSKHANDTVGSITHEEILPPPFCGKYSNHPQVDSLLCFAFSNIGKPYRGGSAGPNSFDCSGFTTYVYGNFGYKLNRSSGSQLENGVKVDREELAPGDLVFFKGRNAHASRIGHVGIVSSVNDDRSFSFIHSANGTGITHDQSTSAYYLKRYVAACRVISSESTTPYTPRIVNPVAIDSDSESEQVEDESNNSKKPYEYSRKLKRIKVQRGQTLYSIAKEYNCTVKNLKEWNHLKRTQLHVGQKIIVHLPQDKQDKEKEETAIACTPTATQPSVDELDVEIKDTDKDQSTEHIVLKGENLFSIAVKHACTISDLKAWNELEGSKVYPGQKLKLKGEEGLQNEPQHHLVERGESLYSLAQKYKTTIQDLEEINSLESKNIKIGQRIRVK